MFNRSAVLLAAAVLLASSGLVVAEAPKLSLDPTVITADATAPQGSLMLGLDKAGIGQPLSDAKLNISGWIESGYTYSARHGTYFSSHPNEPAILPGPFNHEHGNRYMLNQAVLQVSRDVDSTKFDVGGLVEFMYGSDAAKIHSGGLGYYGSDPTDNGSPDDPDSAGDGSITNFNPVWQFDIPQAYVTVNVPIGNGLQIMVGKFATLLSYESFNANANSFYSHSYIYSATPFTQTGVLGSMQVNDMFNMKLGMTRGWDMATEDNNGAVDVLGQFILQPSKQLSFSLAYSIGPENMDDNTHQRIAIDPIVRWQATDALSFGFEWLYVFDGGWNATPATPNHHAYGDVWGGALYAAYKVNDNLTVNARMEGAHGKLGSFGGFTFPGGATSASVWEITLGATITPLPKNDLLKGLSIRPEIRYDFTDSTQNEFFQSVGGPFQNQLTFGFDLIYAF
jgi:hypothetical protein